MNYVKSVLSGFSNFLNALAGGNPDVSISARTGYLASKLSLDTRWFWLLVQYFIDLIFLPSEGPGHCRRAYLADKEEKFKAGGVYRLSVLGVIIIMVSIPLIIVTYLYANLNSILRRFF